MSYAVYALFSTNILYNKYLITEKFATNHWYACCFDCYIHVIVVLVYAFACKIFLSSFFSRFVACRLDVPVVCTRGNKTWWRHQIETFSALLALCAGNLPVTGEFSSPRPVTRSFDVFIDLRLNKRLSKQWWGCWFDTSLRPLWRHCNDWYSYPSMDTAIFYHRSSSLSWQTRHSSCDSSLSYYTPTNPVSPCASGCHWTESHLSIKYRIFHKQFL